MQNEVYIIGGGPSLENFPFGLLKDKDTIAVNQAALDIPNPTYCITADSAQFKKLQEGYFKDVDTTWVFVTNPNHCTMKWKDGRFVHKNGYVYNLFAANMVIRNAGVEGIGFSFKDFRTGYNSGFCAFQLAVLLGYRRIFLLGIDLNHQDPKHHYHDRYKGRKISQPDMDKYYANFVKALNIIKADTDIQVYSCSSTSRLNSIIPYRPFSSGPIPKLSILICHIKGREAELAKLMEILNEQRTLLMDEVEVVIEKDEGQMTIGAKRNLLLQRAKGDYIAFVDDDDLVSTDYIQKILEAIETGPDCCSIVGEISTRKFVRRFVHSIKYQTWFINKDVYYRCPNHLNPVRRELALETGFLEMNRGEDKDYSLRLRKILTTEVEIQGIIYHYLVGT